MPAAVPRDIADAVRDTVTVRGPTEYGARTRVARSHTAQQVFFLSPAISHLTFQQDSAQAHPKAAQSSFPLSGSTPPRQVQVQVQIQEGFSARRCHRPSRFHRRRAQLFHHDGPFDACAPSRNRQRNNAPMFAWSPRQEDLVASDPGAYPSPDAYKPFSTVDPPKKKVDAIAEAWGIHEPEPYEEFFAGGGTGRADTDTPASSIYNGRDSHNKKRTTKELRSLQSPPLDSARQPKRSVPPPQPIFVPDSPDQTDSTASSPPLSPGGNPQRKKSLMQRIRKMRDAPNVPVSSDYDQPPSPSTASEPSSSRPTHRPQNSFLGRFAGSRGAQPGTDKSEPFVYIEQSNKELPPPPTESESPPEVAGYFDSAANGTNSGSSGMVRKSSLMKKVGRVVGRTRQ
ncbi:hypothetical protein C0995_011815 [Termitomyces sp. Mi166|nr:hypothetical protein C0995_011815 [Termitomyces sp. Mi166\